MKKKAYHLLFLNNLKKTRSRFLSIFLIVFLGTAFFAGLRNAPETMNMSMGAYLKDNSFADLSLISTFGFTNEDVSEVSSIVGVKEAVGVYRVDGIFEVANIQGDYSAIIHSYQNDFHQNEIIYGRNIQNNGECLIDSRFADESLIGSIITIKKEEQFIELEIVGLVNDTRYIVNMQRGTNSESLKSNDAFIIANSDDIKEVATITQLQELRNQDIIYNEILVSYDIDDNILIFDDEYDNLTKTLKANISDTLQEKITATRLEIVNRYQSELAEPLSQYEEGLNEYQQGLDEFNLTMNEAKVQLLEGKIELIENQKQLLDAQSQINNELGSITGEIDDLNQSIALYQQQINDLTIDVIPEIEQPNGDIELPDVEIPNGDIELPDIELPDVELPDVELPNGNVEVPNMEIPEVESPNVNANTNNALNQVKEQVNQMSSDITVLLDNLKVVIAANVNLTSASLQLEQASLELQRQEAILENMEIETKNSLAKAKEELDNAKIQIDAAYDKINAIPEGKLYVLSKDENAGVVSFSSDSQAIASLAVVFPLMFFLVAALVSLTTMTRMIEEQRLQSGTMLALGYSKHDVMRLYVQYVLLATVLASILGIILGTFIFTNIIYYLYNSLMYSVGAKIIVTFTKGVIPLTLLIAVAITLFVTIIVLFQELNDTPSQLLRPKPPKEGKRVILERITFIWKKLSFNQKVTIRNIFRYKKRFFMSIAGIAGCSALIVTGFGLKNSISQIVPLQFDHIWQYDGYITLDETDKNIDETLNIVNLQYNISDTMALYDSITTIESNASTTSLNGNYMVVSRRNNEFIMFNDLKNNKISLEDEGVIITQKASEVLNVKIGDSILININDISYNVKISNICQNYSGHYIYMSKPYYENLVNNNVTYNSIIFKMKDNSESVEKSLEQTLLKQDFIKNIVFISSLNEQFESILKSIDIVVVIIIFIAGLLAFIVLYNLTNINIQERMNEIATIKVLGFYNNEVYSYVFRENVILSLIGSSVGLVAGKILHQYLIRTVEIDATMFYRGLNIQSYVYAVILTTIFTLIINRIMRPGLDNIDMIESLKSVE